MPRAPKEYQRLPGRGTLLDGDKWYATSRAMCTVWLGRDHLLLVSRAGYTENYKRFYFRDIQAIIIRKTVTSLIGNTVIDHSGDWLHPVGGGGFRLRGQVCPGIPRRLFHSSDPAQPVARVNVCHSN